MPKTSVHEYHSSPTRKHDIWTTRELCVTEAKAKPGTMEHFSHNPLRARIAATHGTHHAASHLKTDDVCHPIRPMRCTCGTQKLSLPQPGARKYGGIRDAARRPPRRKADNGIKYRMSWAQSHDIQMISLPLQDYAATMHVSPPAFSPILSPRRAVAPYPQKPDTGAEPP